jgi:FkbM family methyltransferase
LRAFGVHLLLARGTARFDMTSQGEALRQIPRELAFYFLRAMRVPEVSMDGIRILVDYKRWSPLLVRRILAKRYEVEERQMIPRILKPEDRVLEIGGGVGLMAMLCARVVGEENVVVYEANPEIRERALANVRHNGMKIAIEHAAVVSNDYAGEQVTFFVSENFWSSSLLDKGGKQVRIDAPALRLGALIEKHRPTLIIADVEGAEYDIFRHADLGQVQKLCIEFHTRYIGVSKVSELVRSILEQGFELELERSIGEVLYFARPVEARPSARE